MSILHFLLTDAYWLSAQGLIQNASGVLMVWGGLMMWHHSCDSRWWCWRPGMHPVAGTSWRTCANHKTTDIHRHMFHRHEDKHPARG